MLARTHDDTRWQSLCFPQLGLKFPKPGAESAHQHIIDLGRHHEASLMAAAGHTFPLIIRLETITEEGHSLQVRCLGAAKLGQHYTVLCCCSCPASWWTRPLQHISCTLHC